MAKSSTLEEKRLAYLLLIMGVVVGIIVLKLFYMQIIKHADYVALAQEGRQGYRELEARRGEIYINDYHSGEDFRLATNITLDTVYADPYLIDEPKFVADRVAPLLFDEKEAVEAEETRLTEQRKELINELTEEEIQQVLKPRSAKELKEQFLLDVYQKLSAKIREEITLVQGPSVALRKAVRQLNLPGIEVGDQAIYAYPKKITGNEEYAVKLGELLDIPVERLQAILEGKNRYVILKKKVRPEVVEKLDSFKKEYAPQFKGIAFQEETYRYYPEQSLAAQVLGFLNTEKDGIYGVEASFNEELKGEAGIFKAQLDGAGRQITVGDDVVIESAKDGADLYLTLDRSIQKTVEGDLAQAVIASQADAGQAIVMDPKTGKILAMAHYPTFNPNEYWKSLETESIILNSDEEKKIIKKNFGGEDETYLVLDQFTDRKIRLFPIVSDKTNAVHYEKFKNDVGSGVYRNRVVSDIYEPGSVFKAITMSIALDAAGVTPDEQVLDNGPIKVDEFTIDNALGKHYGLITMTQVLETSNNIGMAYVAHRLGASLFYTYIRKYGFARPTDIEFLDEQSGKVEKFNKWADSELVTHAFGQGISVTPIQMVTAISALANDGVLMEPYIIEQVVQGKDVKEREPQIVHQVVSQATAETLTAMLVSVVEKGQLGALKHSGYSIAAKTGTSQTYKNGKPLSGAGTTITSMAGFAPADDPKFVILIKLDKPRSSEWAVVVLAPLFNNISDYLFDYFSVPPNS
ncbi:hypothetical protein COV81_04105 [Candidatus Peregrinibacteria bacterium CG11_big_fil_rev_8_21_14_0_20_41_10]|nr:MAG: hypothetical protein COV81_04105 [Candidatus Peregrinibacteria bacterium CG11_big_fil_rev_8_21_14_0_20_41_10]